MSWATVFLAAAIILCLCVVVVINNMQKDKERANKEFIRVQKEVSAHNAWVANLTKMHPVQSHALICKTDKFNKESQHVKK